MRRGKVELKRIENKVSRQVTFSKRRGGLLKKAHELAVLCDAQVGVIVFSSNGKIFEYCGPDCSLRELIHRYETTTNQMLQDANHNNQQMLEISELRHESEHLEASLRKQVGEDLASVATMDELDSLELQLETALGKVRKRKYELLHQQLNDSHQKVHVLEDQNCYLQLIVDGSGHRPAAATEGMPPMLPATAFTHLFFPEEQASTSLQLWPQLPDAEGLGSVQASEPDLQGPSLTSQDLRL